MTVGPLPGGLGIAGAEERPIEPAERGAGEPPGPSVRALLTRVGTTVWRRSVPVPARRAFWKAYFAHRERVEGRRESRSERRPPRALASHPQLRLLVPVRGHSPAAVRASVASVRRQSYTHWTLVIVPEAPGAVPEPVGRALEAADARVHVWREMSSSADRNAALTAAMTAQGAEFVAVVEPGDTLERQALQRVAELLDGAPETDVVYTDERVGPGRWGGRRARERYKPDWSPEHALSEPYTGRLSLYRRALVAEVGGLRADFDAAREYDLLLRLHERAARVRRLPGVMYRRRTAAAPASEELSRAVTDHLRRIGAAAEYVAPSEPATACVRPRVRYRLRGAPRVSIVIPTVGTVTRDVGGRTIDLLANTVRSIAERTEYPHYEIIYVHDRPLRPETLAVLDAVGVPLRAVKYDRPFNWADKMNAGAGAATGEHLLALNDDVEVINGEWMSAMLEFSQQDAVGAVGAKLYFPDGSIQHAGVIVHRGAPDHAYAGLPPERQVGVTDLAVVRNYSAVTGACLMTRLDLFRALGGFAVSFPVNYNDVDYCLRVRARGYRVVFTPHAQLYHYESVSRAHSPGAAGVRASEVEHFVRTWPDYVARDPFYDPRCGSLRWR